MRTLSVQKNVVTWNVYAQQINYFTREHVSTNQRVQVIVQCIDRAKYNNKGKGKGAGFKSWSQAGSHDFTILPRWSYKWIDRQIKEIETYNGYLFSFINSNGNF